MPHKYTEAEKGGTILYISDKLNFKPRKDLEIYAKKDLESCFVEIINKKTSNEIVGVIYRHPNMDTNTFTDEKLTEVMHILSREKNKKVRELERKELRKIESRIDAESKFWTTILSSGVNHNYQDRIMKSNQSESQNCAPKYFMYKDNKAEGVL